MADIITASVDIGGIVQRLRNSDDPEVRDLAVALDLLQQAVYVQDARFRSLSSVANGININAARITDGQMPATRLSLLIPLLAGFTFTSNQPSAGSIAWSTGSLYYAGNVYQIANGASADKYVYWSQASPFTFQTSATYPALTDASFLIATNVSGIYDLVWNAPGTQYLTTSHYGDDSVTNVKIHDLSAVKITTGTLDADRIGANTIRVDKLVVGNFDNLAEDPGFDRLMDSWVPLVGYDPLDYSGTRDTNTTLDATAGRDGGYCLKHVPGVTARAFNRARVACAEGDKFYAQAWAKGISGADGACRVRLYFYDKTDAYLGSGTYVDAISDGTWHLTTDSGTAPANTAYAVIAVAFVAQTAGTWYVDDVYARRLVGNVIIDGDLSASKITTGTLDASLITVINLSASSITTGTLSASYISGGTLDCSLITVTNLSAGSITTGTLDASRLNLRELLVSGLTLTANSPIAGKIAWSACTIYWNGTAYPVTGSNSDKKFVWWDSASPTVFQAADTFASSTGVFLIATNSAGTPDEAWNKVAARAITANQLAPATITTNEISGTAGITSAQIASVNANTVTTGTLDASVVTVTHLNASNIDTGTLDASRIAAAAIDATKLSIKQIIVTALSLTNNSPSAGYVAWSACNVYWNGSAYAITGSNTNKKFVYWDSGNTTFTGADSFTPSATRFLIATNDAGTSDEAWNKLANRGIQETNLGFSLLTGQQIQDPVTASCDLSVCNGVVIETILLSTTGDGTHVGGGLIALGARLTSLPAVPCYLNFKFEIDGQPATTLECYGGSDGWNNEAATLATSIQGDGTTVGDHLTFYLWLGFTASLVVKAVKYSDSGSGASLDASILYCTKTT